MILQQLALVSTVPEIDPSQMAQVAAALQKQVSRDFAPLWGIEATIGVFPSFEDVPVGYWPVVVVDEAPQPGLHRDFNHQPIAYVVAGPTWSLAASHEVIEMLVDPWGNRLVAGDAPLAGAGRVEFLVEVCDPCQDAAHAYTVNGVLVSDFCTPDYFDPLGVGGVRYSYSGAVPGPHQVLPGGYLTWRVPETGNWIQLRNAGGAITTRDLGPMRRGPLALRTMIDEKTPEKRELSRISRESVGISGRRGLEVAERERYARGRAEGWHELTRQVRKGL